VTLDSEAKKSLLHQPVKGMVGGQTFWRWEKRLINLEKVMTKVIMAEMQHLVLLVMSV